MAGSRDWKGVKIGEKSLELGGEGVTSALVAHSIVFSKVWCTEQIFSNEHEKIPVAVTLSHLEKFE